MVPEPALGLDPGDQARVGQKNTITWRWARRGTRPRAPHDQCTKSATIFNAIHPAEGKGAGPVLPRCTTQGMALHLAEIATTVAPGAHAILILDKAGWHVSKALPVPANIGLPARDLRLSPGHPVLVGADEDDVLVPIMCLIDGITIARVPVEKVTYWHVELDDHDVLLA